MHITHNLSTHRFETTLDGHTAFLSYQILDNNTLNYNHTIVPSELGGRGIGTALVKFALDYAMDNGKAVIPSCSFVASYIAKHPAYRTVLA